MLTEVVKLSLISICGMLNNRPAAAAQLKQAKQAKGSKQPAGLRHSQLDQHGTSNVRRALKSGFDAVSASPSSGGRTDKQLSIQQLEARFGSIEARMDGQELRAAENMARLMSAESKSAQLDATISSAQHETDQKFDVVHRELQTAGRKMEEVEESKRLLMKLSVRSCAPAIC